MREVRLHQLGRPFLGLVHVTDLAVAHITPDSERAVIQSVQSDDRPSVFGGVHDPIIRPLSKMGSNATPLSSDGETDG